MKRFKWIVSWVLVMVLLSGCASNVEPVNSAVTFKKSSLSKSATTKQVVSGINQMGFDLFKHLPYTENSLLSPVSMGMALSLLSNAANPSLEEGFADLLGGSNLSIEERNETINGLLNKFYKMDSDGEFGLKVANSVWGSSRYAINEGFSNTAKSSFDAEIYSVPLTSDKTISKMNQWVEDKTEGLLKGTFKTPFGNSTLAILINTTYFNGEWLSTYKSMSTYDEPFYAINGRQKNVSMMHQTDNCLYREDELAQVAVFPYVGGVKMTVILPKNDFGDFVNQLTYNEYVHYLNASEMMRTKLDISMPKFEYEVENPLNDYLKESAIKAVFDSNNPMLDALFDEQKGYVSKVFQNTRIINEESGTQAAAVTVIVDEATAVITDPPKVVAFNMNRPFIYVIEEAETGTHLFLGAYTE